MSDQTTSFDPNTLAKVQEARRKLREELGRVIVGQEAVIDQLLICLFSRGHALLVGVPGLAKTLLVRSLAQALDLSFSRIQFTPDLMPADITGTEVLQEDRQTGTREFRFHPRADLRERDSWPTRSTARRRRPRPRSSRRCRNTR